MSSAPQIFHNIDEKSLIKTAWSLKTVSWVAYNNDSLFRFQMFANLEKYTT